ncbi:MAG: VOC family protein [Acidimicrobiia bacterium]|nr:VOC family protein [Acidimicrobiia bacterium]
MAVPTGLNHVAMSVPPGTLTDEWRAELLEFYGALLGWREIESLRLPDRLTISVGQHSYVNLRERADPMTCSGYEHFGIVVASGDEAQEIWNRLNEHPLDVSLEPLTTDDREFRNFRFRYLLPLAIEVQSFP